MLDQNGRLIFDFENWVVFMFFTQLATGWMTTVVQDDMNMLILTGNLDAEL